MDPACPLIAAVNVTTSDVPATPVTYSTRTVSVPCAPIVIGLVRRRVQVNVAHDLLNVTVEETFCRLCKVKSCVVSFAGCTLIDVSGVTLIALIVKAMVAVSVAIPPNAVTVSVPAPPPATAVQFRVNEFELWVCTVRFVGVVVQDASELGALLKVNESSSMVLFCIVKTREKGALGATLFELVHGVMDSLETEQDIRPARPVLVPAKERLSWRTAGARHAAAARGVATPLRTRPRTEVEKAMQCRVAVRRRMGALPSGGNSAAMH